MRSGVKNALRFELAPAVLTALAAASLAGCLDRREPDGVSPRDECGTCHGGVLPAPFTAAPPTSLAGDVERSARGVGAHEAHLSGNDWSRPIACADCHAVPGAVDDPGHIDSEYPAEVHFPAVARAFEAEPSFDAETGQCKNTFCHGGSFVGHRPSGGAVVEPVWNDTDPAIASCDGCHGLPPPLPHPEADACSDCHQNIDSERKFVRPELHVDGKVTFYVVD